MPGPLPILPNGLCTEHPIHEVWTRPAHAVGTRAWLPDGRVFYYAYNHTTAALTLGEIIVTATVTPNHHDQTVNAAADFTAGSVNVVLNPGATAIVLEEYVDGYAFVSDGTGQGLTYKIRSHAGNAGSTQSVAELYDPVVTTTAAASTVSLVRNPYMNPQQSNTTVSEIPVGIPQVTITAATTAATATARVVDPYYGWLQTWGPCAVLCDEAVTAEGQAITIGTGTAGAAEADDTATTVSQEFIIGYNLTPLVDTEYQMVDLRIRP